jgi:hypothetical protein
LLALCACLLLAPLAARADLGFRPEDRVTLTQVDDRILAVTAAGFAAVLAPLELGESVVALRSQGNVGVAVTSRRLLAIQARAANFVQLRYRVSETPPGEDDLHVRDRLIVAALPARILAFSAQIAAWRELGLGPGEKPIEVLADQNVAVVVTPRRAVAFSPLSNGFIEYPLSPGESPERSTLGDDSVTLILPHRILIFRAGDKRWSSLNR